MREAINHRYSFCPGLFLAVSAFVMTVSCNRNLAPNAASWPELFKSFASMPVEAVVRAQDSLCRLAIESKVKDSTDGTWDILLQLEEKYFYDPNSPFRNEEYYLPVLKHIASATYSTVSQKERADYLLPLFSLNRLGTPAADFEFITSKGKVQNLYSIEAEYIVLFFSNPGCENCKEITESFKNSRVISEMIKSGRLAVLNIYPDEFVDKWKEYLPNYPGEWICGWNADGSLKSDTIYYLRAIPSLYLLDCEKRVMAKDAPLERIERILYTAINK